MEPNTLDSLVCGQVLRASRIICMHPRYRAERRAMSSKVENNTRDLPQEPHMVHIHRVVYECRGRVSHMMRLLPCGQRCARKMEHLAAEAHCGRMLSKPLSQHNGLVWTGAKAICQEGVDRTIAQFILRTVGPWTTLAGGGPRVRFHAWPPAGPRIARRSLRKSSGVKSPKAPITVAAQQWGW